MGGNIFNSTGPIPREWIDPTLREYNKELARLFPKKKSVFGKFAPVGSVGKKPMSGDIDLAIDISMLVDKKFSPASIKKWNIDPVKVVERFHKLKARARSATEAQLMTKAMLQEIALYISNNSKVIEIDQKRITPANMFGAFPQIDENGKKQKKSVQVDWMVGNIKWLKFSYYSEEYKGNVKGLHRTQLILAMFDAFGYTFNHGAGVKSRQTGEMVAKTPIQAMKVLTKEIGQEVDEKVLANYFKLRPWLKEVLSKKDYDKVIGIYLKILDRTRCDVPDDIQADWKKRKTKLKLTGKFLPKDSKLVSENTIVNSYRKMITERQKTQQRWW